MGDHLEFLYQAIDMKAVIVLYTFVIAINAMAEGPPAEEPAEKIPVYKYKLLTSPTHKTLAPAPAYKPVPAPTYKPAPAPTYKPAPAPTYNPAPAPTYKPAPAPVHVPAPLSARAYVPSPAPAYKPAPAYVPAPAPYRPAPAPAYKPAPAYVPAPVPAYKPAPVPAYKPAPAPAYKPAPSYKEPSYGPASYQYAYEVKDEYAGVDFGAQEARDGYSTDGQYQVLLPDGRLQTVSYGIKDGYSGYVADVVYTGEAKYDPVPAPQYKPAPSYHQG